MPDVNDEQFERASGSPAQIGRSKLPMTDGPVCIPIVTRRDPESLALVNVTTFDEDDETDHGTIEIPREFFDSIRSEGVHSVDWSEDCVTINFGLHRKGISIHLCPKED